MVATGNDRELFSNVPCCTTRFGGEHRDRAQNLSGRSPTLNLRMTRIVMLPCCPVPEHHLTNFLLDRGDKFSALVEYLWRAPETFVWTRIAQHAKQRPAGGITSGQSIEADALMWVVDLAAHQSMEQMPIDAEGVAEQMDATVLVASTHKDHRAPERSVEIELNCAGRRCRAGGNASPGIGLGVGGGAWRVP